MRYNSIVAHFFSINILLNTPFIIPSPIQEVCLPQWRDKSISVFIKRDDQIHRLVQGNKWRKLKYNILEAKRLGKQQLLTFGGAFSNHIHATAALGRIHNFHTIGIIRGERLPQLSPTLQFAEAQNMRLVFMDRSTYRQRKEISFLNALSEQYPNAYIIPEGGSNSFALRGVGEIVEEVCVQLPKQPFIWCVGVGSGGTIAGLINAVKEGDRIMGFSALKGSFIENMVLDFLEKPYDNWQIWQEDNFGGFAKWHPSLIEFINAFYESTQIPLDPIYNGKLWYRLDRLICKGHFKAGTRLMVIHSGGLQGIAGFKERFQVDLLPDWTY